MVKFKLSIALLKYLILNFPNKIIQKEIKENLDEQGNPIIQDAIDKDSKDPDSVQKSLKDDPQEDDIPEQEDGLEGKPPEDDPLDATNNFSERNNLDEIPPNKSPIMNLELKN